MMLSPYYCVYIGVMDCNYENKMYLCMICIKITKDTDEKNRETVFDNPVVGRRRRFASCAEPRQGQRCGNIR